MSVFYSRVKWLGRLAVLPLGILLLGACTGNQPEQPRRPNILLILADDLGNNDLASWGDGSAPTPTLDELSQQSVRFRSHYTDSTCSVSRAALLSARHPVEIGFEPDGIGLSHDLQTLPRTLKGLGYRTVHVGKWHVGEMHEYPGVWPLQQGFDEWFGAFNHFVLSGPDERGLLVRKRPAVVNPWLQLNNEPLRQYPGYLDDLLTDYAVKQIEQSADGGAPWFINLWYLSPHTPHQPSEAFARQFSDDPAGRYLAVLAQLDHNVRRVLQKLEESGQADDTIVVFASDNGSPTPARNYPFTGIKTSYREGGVRSPLIIHWPGRLERRDVEGVTHITDLYPTLVGLAGGDVPPDLSGRDLSAELTANRPLPKVEALHWAADSALGQFYGVHFPGRGLFASDLQAPLALEAGMGPVHLAERTPAPDLSRERTQEILRDWERQVRPVSLKWQVLSNSSGSLSGRDYQRIPAIGGYALGLALGASAPEAGEQTLFHQQGVWSLHLQADGHLRLRYGDVQVLSEQPVQLGRACNSVITSLFMAPVRTFPFPSSGSTQLWLYVNGEQVGMSEQVMFPPEQEAALRNPTFIGVGSDGSAPYSGTVRKPILISKHIVASQPGYGLADFTADLCAP